MAGSPLGKNAPAPIATVRITLNELIQMAAPRLMNQGLHADKSYLFQVEQERGAITLHAMAVAED